MEAMYEVIGAVVFWAIAGTLGVCCAVYIITIPGDWAYRRIRGAERALFFSWLRRGGRNVGKFIVCPQCHLDREEEGEDA